MYTSSSKQSSSNSNINKIHYEAKKHNYNNNQYKHKPNYRKQTRYQDDEPSFVQHEFYHEKKYYNNNKTTRTTNKDPSGDKQSRLNQNDIVNKISVSKNTQSQSVSYMIEFRNKEIELGSTWKEILQSIDRYFPQTDMILNLAVKINVWEELRNIKSMNIPNQDVQEIFILFGKYKGNKTNY